MLSCLAMPVLAPTGSFSFQYDLKGCADDKTQKKDGAKVKEVHKRIFKVHMW